MEMFPLFFTILLKDVPRENKHYSHYESHHEVTADTRSLYTAPIQIDRTYMA